MEDGRRERKPSIKKIVNRTRFKHPDFRRGVVVDGEGNGYSLQKVRKIGRNFCPRPCCL